MSASRDPVADAIRANAAAKPVPRPRASWRADGCEPCGGCRACRREASALAEGFRLRREVAALRRMLRRALLHVDSQAEADVGDGLVDPVSARARRLGREIRRRLAKGGG